MIIKEACEKLGLNALTGDGDTVKEIRGVYICDLLSWVMAHGKKGDAWITVQTHSNVVAVASLLELSCVIVPEGIEVEADTLKKARDEGITMLQSVMSAYELAKAFYEAGIE